MFSLFKKKEASVKVIDKVWISENAKWNGIREECKKDNSTIVIAWFSSTAARLETFMTGAAFTVHLAREIHTSQLTGKRVLFAEHHPLRSKEQEQYQQWQLKEAIVCSALEEPLFKKFGSDKIIAMMKQLGMKEEECVEHRLISGAIENAQKKIGKKVITEHLANSQEEWMERNLPD
ncbi:MAG: hypothetical protein JNK14_02520 [Chitinophagaceae bacterium]|nr:hypothetical protein [Chitinophagaceae bacterium]